MEEKQSIVSLESFLKEEENFLGLDSPQKVFLQGKKDFLARLFRFYQVLSKESEKAKKENQKIFEENQGKAPNQDFLQNNKKIEENEKALVDVESWLKVEMVDKDVKVFEAAINRFLLSIKK